MQALYKDIKVLLKRYVDAAEDPRLTDHWKKIDGENGSTASSPPEPAKSKKPRGRGRKKRSRPDGESVRRDSNDANEVQPRSVQRTVQRTLDEDSQGHTGAEDQDLQLPLGRRTRSMVTATVGQVPRVRRQQRSRASSQRHKKSVRL
ncbi:hypothetical protein DVH05_027647 [Phytophthora capsici]|nr:hypothetical protein DVH05_027647 [Phytophthora capsici]